MKVIRSIRSMADFSRNAHIKGKTIGFVPTMGALHEGHLSLIRQARKENDVVVVSVFVNPVQFGPKEDYKHYPRNLKRDTELSRKSGADIVFYPDAGDMYFFNHKTYIEVCGLSGYLCGKFRPGHFKGVATVVAKLFNIINPDTSYFGQKDAQQAIVIKKMVEDLNIPVRIKVMPTVREKDGLAMSSRNKYLDKKERADAAVLYQALRMARDLISHGVTDSLSIIRKMRQLISSKKSARIQYISIVNPVDLSGVNTIKERVLIALSVYIGKTRLIDNIVVSP
ncbi:MAG: pantoate--beta-alanine ligase [Candidatus Omnitrophica bacterium]|nr:pantoate--beta-alanine ligase [Candidatus Omnitrophota bacterium]